ncbi:hypothetical protein BYT27DRAFT_7130196 [Phlegmacium glaucopus]|nr:hypothetical protein BYT27DRAFT_7130196 [Phlegmacium glaucopus]
MPVLSPVIVFYRNIERPFYKTESKHHSLLDLYAFSYQAMPEEGVLSLQDLHHIASDTWLTRFDEYLEKESSSSKEMKLEERKLLGAELYRIGIEIIDLTHGPTVGVFRRWDKEDLAFIQRTRFTRIYSSEPEVVSPLKAWKASFCFGINDTFRGRRFNGRCDG